MSWGSFSNLEEKKRWKMNTDHMDSIELLSPRKTMNTVNIIGTLKCSYIFFNEWLWRQKVLCLTWSFFCYAGIHDTSPSFFRWGTVLWGVLLQIFTCWLPFYACCYWKAGKLSQSGYAKNTSKSKQLPGIELWKSVEGTEIQWNLSSRPFWKDLLL